MFAQGLLLKSYTKAGDGKDKPDKHYLQILEDLGDKSEIIDVRVPSLDPYKNLQNKQIKLTLDVYAPSGFFSKIAEGSQVQLVKE